jgi:hypothetical protein
MLDVGQQTPILEGTARRSCWSTARTGWLEATKTAARKQSSASRVEARKH